MVLFNHSTRELTAKIVFYGPGLCGKTTNLKILHEKLDKQSVGKLLSLSTAQDRTIYFDLLPVELGNIKGYTVRFQLCTVPGQVFYNETRKLVLKGVDGIVFVVDSQPVSLSHNLESFQNLKDNLAELDRPFDQIPIVIQYNKRDLAGVLSIEELQDSLAFRSYPFVEAIANQGPGVVETFRLVSKLTFTDLMRRLQKPGGMEIAADLLFDKPRVPVPRQEPDSATVRVAGVSERLTPPPVPALTPPPKPKREDAWLQLLGREEKKPSPPTNSGRDLLGMAVAASTKLEPPKHPPKTVENPFDISSSWPVQAGTDVFAPGARAPRPPVPPPPGSPAVPPRPVFYTRPHIPPGPPSSGVLLPPPPPPPYAGPPLAARDLAPAQAPIAVPPEWSAPLPPPPPPAPVFAPPPPPPATAAAIPEVDAAAVMTPPRPATTEAEPLAPPEADFREPAYSAPEPPFEPMSAAPETTQAPFDVGAGEPEQEPVPTMRIPVFPGGKASTLLEPPVSEPPVAEPGDADSAAAVPTAAVPTAAVPTAIVDAEPPPFSSTPVELGASSQPADLDIEAPVLLEPPPLAEPAEAVPEQGPVVVSEAVSGGAFAPALPTPEVEVEETEAITQQIPVLPVFELPQAPPVETSGQIFSLSAPLPEALASVAAPAEPAPAIGNRLDEITTRLDELSSRARVEPLTEKLESLVLRMDGIERTLDAGGTARKQAEIAERLAALETRLEETAVRLTAEAAEKGEESSRRVASLSASVGELRDSLTGRLVAEGQALKERLEGFVSGREEDRSQILAVADAVAAQKVASAALASADSVSSLKSEVEVRLSALKSDLDSMASALTVPAEGIHEVRVAIQSLKDELAVLGNALAEESEARRMAEKRLQEEQDAGLASLKAELSEALQGLRERLEQIPAAVTRETAASASALAGFEKSTSLRFEALEQTTAELMTVDSVSTLLDLKLAALKTEFLTQLEEAQKSHRESLEAALVETRKATDRAASAEGKSRQLFGHLRRALSEFEEVSSSAEKESGDPPASPAEP